MVFFFFFQAEDGIRDYKVTGVQTCALPISLRYPERTTVSVKSLRDYYRPRRSLPSGVGVRAETRALPVERVIGDRPAVPEAEPQRMPGSAPMPRQSPVSPPRWPPSPSSLRPASLARRTEPSTG